MLYAQLHIPKFIGAMHITGDIYFAKVLGAKSINNPQSSLNLGIGTVDGILPQKIKIFNGYLTSPLPRMLKCILSEIQTQCGLTDIVAFLHCYTLYLSTCFMINLNK